jgi:hypothetical protein
MYPFSRQIVTRKSESRASENRATASVTLLSDAAANQTDAGSAANGEPRGLTAVKPISTLLFPSGQIFVACRQSIRSYSGLSGSVAELKVRVVLPEYCFCRQRRCVRDFIGCIRTSNLPTAGVNTRLSGET